MKTGLLCPQMRRFHVALHDNKMNKAEQVIKTVQADQSVLFKHLEQIQITDVE